MLKRPFRGKYAAHLMAVSLIIGSLGWAQESPESKGEWSVLRSEDGPPTKDGLWVEVETSVQVPSDVTGVYMLVPYRNRREFWSQTIALGLNAHSPTAYSPSVSALYSFDQLYGARSLNGLDVQYGLKRNLALGSLGAEIGLTHQSWSSLQAAIPSSLDLTQFRAGLTVFLDNLTYEPYVVPYAVLGVYTNQYHEVLAATEFGGRTQASLYYTLGFALQLNWLDKEAARTAYLDYGIENTYLYAEVRQFMPSQANQDPDFSTAFDLGVGARVEF